MPPAQGRWRVLVGVATVLTAAMAVGCFLLAPTVLMRVNESLTDTDLARMSNAGQAYGGLSALLSGAATGAVAAALLLQIRQIRLSQAQGVRMIQIQLMSMLVERPDLRPVSPTLGDVNPEQRRRDIYTNLMLRYLEMGYEIGYFPATSIQAELRSQFAIDDIRRFWERTRSIQLAGIMNKAQWRFAALVEQAYRQATEDGANRPPVTSPPALPAEPRSRSGERRIPALVRYAVVAAAAAIAGQVIDAYVNRPRGGG